MATGSIAGGDSTYGFGANGMLINPSAVRVATSDNYVDSITATSGDLHKRDVDEKFIKRYGNQGITGLLELLGSKKETNQTNFEHYEEAFLHNSFRITDYDESGTIAVAGDATVITVNVKDGDCDSSGRHFVRKNDVVMLSTGDIALVSATYNEDGTDGANMDEAGDFKLVPYQAWSVSGSTFPADTYATVIGTDFKEGTAQPASRSPEIHEYKNNVMIIKDSFEVTGTEATNVVYFKVENEKLGSGYLWYLKGEADTYRRFQDYAELMMVVGKKALTTSTYAGLSTGQAVRGTEGLLPFIENNGQSMDLGASSITMADFDAIVKSLDKYRGAKENALYAGINLSLDIDDLLAAQSTVSAGAANYGTFGNSKDMALNLGFNSFTRGGYTFHKKTYDLFNHPHLLGATDFKFNGYGMVIPMDTRRDAKTGESIPSLRIRYKAVPGYSREMEHWLTGSAVLKNKTNDTDSLKSHYRTERGFEGFAPNRYLLIKKS